MIIKGVLIMSSPENLDSILNSDERMLVKQEARQEILDQIAAIPDSVRDPVQHDIATKASKFVIDRLTANEVDEESVVEPRPSGQLWETVDTVPAYLPPRRLPNQSPRIK